MCKQVSNTLQSQESSTAINRARKSKGKTVGLTYYCSDLSVNFLKKKKKINGMLYSLPDPLLFSEQSFPHFFMSYSKLFTADTLICHLFLTKDKKMDVGHKNPQPSPTPQKEANNKAHKKKRKALTLEVQFTAINLQTFCVGVYVLMTSFHFRTPQSSKAEC